MRWHARAPPLRASSAWGTTEPQRHHRCGHAEIGRATTNAAMTKCIVHSAASSLGNISALPPSFVGQPRHAPCALCQQTRSCAAATRARSSLLVHSERTPHLGRAQCSLRACGRAGTGANKRKKHVRFLTLDSTFRLTTARIRPRVYTPPASSPETPPCPASDRARRERSD